MLLVVDAGNTRTKWAQVLEDGRLGAMEVTANTSLRTSALKKAIENADKIIVANVAGDKVEQQLADMVPKDVALTFVIAQAEACNVVNHYEENEKLGIDRWAAVVAAWQMNKQPTIVINAGTAITIDALSRDKISKKGIYLGGSIMPGLQLMCQALGNNGANLPSDTAGKYTLFPKNTQDAIATGCMNAVIGAVVLQLKQLEKHCAFLPKVVISGGDAVKIAEALNPQLKRVVVVDDLVLQGLALLERE